MPSPIVQQPKTVDFASAINAIKEGKKVTKLEWNDNRIYIALIDGRLKITLPENSFAPVDLIVTDGDIFGTDFIVLE